MKRTGSNTLSQNLLYLVLLTSFLSFLVACSSNHNIYNPYDYVFNEQLLTQKPIKNIMLIPINRQSPSRYYLTHHQEDIDLVVKDYLEDNGFSTPSNRTFKSLWRKAKRQYGDMYNPSTGLRTPAFKKAIESTLSQLFNQQPTLDAVLFTDLIEVPVKFEAESSRIATWNGVRRKLKVQGIGNGINNEFDWSQIVDGISITTYLYDRNQQLIFHSVGGIQVAQAMELKNNSGKFKRRKDLLTNKKEVKEGIQISLHPFIAIKGYLKQ